MFHHLPQPVEEVGTEIAVLGPDIKKIIEAPMVSGVLLPIVGCSVAEQVHHERLQGPAHRGEYCRAVQVVLAVMEQIIEEIKYVEPATLRRRGWLSASWSFIEGLCQCYQIFGQPSDPVGGGEHKVE